MGLTDLFSDFLLTFAITEAHAEAPPEDKDEGSEDKEEAKDDDGEDSKEGDGEGEGGEEEEEEEEDEPVDQMPVLTEKCADSKQCAPYKHHFEECAERVKAAEESGDKKGPKEDCVEEFFHLAHCAGQCAAPKLWFQLK